MARRGNSSYRPRVQSRRQFLAGAAGFGGALLLGPSLLGAEQSTDAAPQVLNNAPVPSLPSLAPADDALLEDICKASAQFFFEQSHPDTGLTKDRSAADGRDARDVASLAATGFGLTALCIAEKRGWADSQKIREQVRVTLRFMYTKISNEHGFFYHFLNMRTGQRVFSSEVSSIDTAIFLTGALTCKAYFDDDEIRDLATKLYERADFAWLLRGQKIASMGWTPEHQFIGTNWDTYSELMMLYLLGLGSPTHALPPEVWAAWGRPMFDFYGVRYIGAYAPLFAHQFSHAWFDFRGKRDNFANYFTNSILATRVHKQWCLGLSGQFPDYTEDLWGISASDSPHGYTVWGGPPMMGHPDGSIVPCAAAGSLPFLPAETLRVLRTIRDKFGDKAVRKYGFVDAFNPLTNWYASDVIGIDVGITLLMAENLRTGFVWEQFMKDDAVQRGMIAAGFHAEGGATTPASQSPTTAPAATAPVTPPATPPPPSLERSVNPFWPST